MRNPYDSAHQLAKDLSQSNEYQEFKNAGVKAKEDKTLLKQLQDFMQKQMVLEFEMMSGQNPNEEKLKELEGLYQLIQLHPDGVGFLEKQMKFQRLMADLMKIINDSVVEGNQILAEKVEE
jgi:cell fate (sporulation/competence/biofilm development) regulator YlbF (YheA/YmcA/DUF963 family)